MRRFQACICWETEAFFNRWIGDLKYVTISVEIFHSFLVLVRSTLTSKRANIYWSVRCDQSTATALLLSEERLLELDLWTLVLINHDFDAAVLLLQLFMQVLATLLILFLARALRSDDV